jgi:predicted nucleic acid-binding protein
MNAVDTNIFVDLHDTDDTEKRDVATRLMNHLATRPRETVFLWQVVSEYLNALRRAVRQGRLVESHVMPLIRDLATTFPLVVPGPRTIDHDERLFDQYSLSHWDAMLLAACRDAGVTTLYSEDLAAGTDYGGVVVVNPFARPVA